MATPTLTPEQQEIFSNVLRFCNTPQGGMCLISGPAGTGKTFLTSKLIEALKGRAIAITSPTHKSIKVLRQMVNVTDKKIPFTTIHSALGLREQIDGFGKCTFVADKTTPNKLDGASILIVDEASMLQDELFYMINRYVTTRKMKVIFIGDPVQIPPIGKIDSKPFSEEAQRLHKIEVYNLTKIVRQGNGHPVIKKSLEIREDLNHALGIKTRTNEHSESGTVRFLKRDEILNLLISNFASDAFRDDTDYARVLAWTNEQVRNYNDLIRLLIFKEDKLPKLVKGERLIMESPVIEKNKVLLSVNDEVEIIDTKILEEKMFDGTRIKYYEALVKYETAFFSNVNIRLKILHEDSERDFNKVLDLYMRQAKSHKPGSYHARNAWVAYYEMKRKYDQVSYAYSLTVHRSQGSTFENCFVDEADICLNKNVVERNRILYTSITRAKKNVYILN